MAQFRATIQGSRGEVSRLAGAKSGILTETNGWNSGVTVIGQVEDGSDVFDIFMTTGSSHKRGKTHIGSVILKDGEPIFVKRR